MKFAIQCFDRCSQLPGKNLKTIRDGGKIWKEVTSVLMEPCVNTVLKHLVHGESLYDFLILSFSFDSGPVCWKTKGKLSYYS